MNVIHIVKVEGTLKRQDFNIAESASYGLCPFFSLAQ